MSEVVEFHPTGEGDRFDWSPTPSGGTWQRLFDYDGPDDDTGFVSSNAGGQGFLITTDEGRPYPGVVSSVGWVSVLARARRTAIGGPTGIITPIVRNGGVEWEGSQLSLGTAYSDANGANIPQWHAELDPATGKPWTLDAARACQVGLVDRTDGGHAVRCTLVRKLVFVNYGRSGAMRYPQPHQRE